MMVKIESPTVMVPARSGLPGGFGLTLKVTRPLPVPVGAPVIVIHAALGVAVHVQAAPVVTVKLNGPPAAGNPWTLPVNPVSV
jgi:hypothetical protein